MPGMTWDPEGDQRLLMAIIAAHSISIDFEAVATHMGNVCTPRAVQERLKKIKKAGLEAGPAKPTSAVASPRKRGKKPKTNVKSEAEDDKLETQVNDSEGTTEMLTDLGSDIENPTQLNGEDDDNTKAEAEAPAAQTGKGKAAKPKLRAKPKSKPKAAEPKPAKAPKAPKSTKAKADGSASPVKANKGIKRKREDADEGEKGDVEGEN